MMWTSAAVICWQVAIISGKQLLLTMSSSPSSSTVVMPGDVCMRENGSNPPTSPAVHSSTFRGPSPRSTRMEKWPASTT